MGTTALGRLLVSAVGKFSETSINQLSGDLIVLQRKWHAAVQPGQSLPSYEEVMLGSLGRLADHIALLSITGEIPEVSRTGRYVQQWLCDDRWDIPLEVLPPDCATALAQAAAGALQNRQPHLGSAHCVRDGMVQKWLPDAAKIMPKDYVDQDGYWIAASPYIHSFSYNTDTVKKGGEPKSLEDLLDPALKGKMAWDNRASNSGAAGFIGSASFPRIRPSISASRSGSG